jgi:uncharacterized protein YcfJ
MKQFSALVVGLSAAMLLEGCAATPMGPTVAVMPSPNKPFQAFQEDQAYCKQFAEQQVAGQAENQNQRAVGVAVVGTVLGAGLGAAVGGGRGAGIGAASGALVGTGIGAGNSQGGQFTIQQQYDNAFSQCMYAKGNQVPGFQPVAFAPPPPPPPPPGPPSRASGPVYDRALVRGVQAELVRLNYLIGPADGSFGPRTKTAISSYEQSKGLLVDGVPTPQLLDHMRAN